MNLNIQFYSYKEWKIKKKYLRSINRASHGHVRPFKSVHTGQVLHGTAEILGDWKETARWVEMHLDVVFISNRIWIDYLFIHGNRFYFDAIQFYYILYIFGLR